MRPHLRVLPLTFVLLFVIVLISVLHKSSNIVYFETFLKSLFISFDDFSPEYTTALKNAENPKGYVEFNFANQSTQIPRIIHFIWHERLYNDTSRPSQIPTIGSDAPKLCRDTNSNYDIRVWNSSASRDLIADEYPWFLSQYDSYRYPIQRIDAFKYFVLWHYGGVYMDMDIACRRSLDPLLHFPAWFPKATPLGVNNDLMAARPSHPVLRRMIDGLHVRNINYLFPYITIWLSTGPQYTTDIISRWHREVGKMLVDTVQRRAKGIEPRYRRARRYSRTDPSSGGDTVFILPPKFYSEEYTFFGHSPGGTWYEGDVTVVLWIIDHLRILLSVFSITAIACAGFALRRRHLRKKAYSLLPSTRPTPE
ncbi:Glycosyltransferase sugar-binding region containing DXD motif-containing protein 2 [Elsinoe fawcettii]|nr:Glycosyltransferase sugar-binding region containing DXD motif-containing protein 2 [Elsinoe fawcettii]